ncbi:piggyBac transposable element-derived protein 4-like [Watersipora subatra]|uniref:piggyBac transposable element-derived protein 4-like n=1 Tax=Watersipora subatra TaxID=2589382 RepID=UPI00355B28A5
MADANGPRKASAARALLNASFALDNILDSSDDENYKEASSTDSTDDTDTEDIVPLTSTPTTASTSATATQIPRQGRRGRPRLLGQRQASQSRNAAPLPRWTVADDNSAPELAYRFIPARPSGVQQDLTNASVIDCFRTLVTDDIIDELVQNINDYVTEKLAMNRPAKRRSRFNEWTPVNKENILKLMAVLIAMGITQKPRMRDYWTSGAVHQTPWYGSMFSRDRFEAIYSTMLHASEVGSQGKAKIEPFVNKLIESFQVAFYPYKEVAVDEMVIGYNGMWSSKQYNSSKPSKYHIKTFGLCDSNTSYVYNLLIYFGADTSYDPELDKDCGEAVRVFDYLIKTLGPGHHIYADRYYTSLKLITFLKSHFMHYTGTLNVSRIGFPLEIKKTLKLQHREHRNYLREDKSILCVAWRDKKAKKCCTLVTTAHHAGQTEVQQHRETVIMPSVIANYNSFMGGCDKMDQILSYYG